MRFDSRILVALALGLAACGGSSRPDAALRAYYTAVAEGRLGDAHDALTAAARGRLVADAGGGADAGFELFRARMTTGGPGAVPWITPQTVAATRIEVLSEDPKVATLGVASPLGTFEVRMVREDGAWRLDL